MKIFDPYNDRLARDIRNRLSSAFIGELSGDGDVSLSAMADDWLVKVTDPIYQRYIQDRLAFYWRAIDRIRADRIIDPRFQAIHLWNLGLFFEMHELLETIWHETSGPEHSALKGWIQAAGVYVHFQRGQKDAARSLAQRAARHLRENRVCLEFIANLGQLIEALADPTDVAPQILPAQS
jgi:hypothetical protein